MRTTRLLLLTCILTVTALAALAGWGGAAAQANSEYFPDTGHFVIGEFLNFYRAIDNSVEIYGYPITEVFQTRNGLTVQYFEKARFELHPAEPAEQRVQLTPLGEYTHPSGLPRAPLADTAACKTFGTGGFLVCYDFLQFYEANGGEARFGAPISNIELYKGTKVQYFKNARLEWRPGVNGQTWIKVANLGAEYFYQIGENPRNLNPVTRTGYRLQDIIRLKARAFPIQSVTARRGTQTVYVLVYDQRATPIEAVDIAVVVRWPSGQESRFIATAPTDASGVTQVSFPVNSNEIGLATIRVEGVYNRIPVNTVTSFRIWW